MSIFERAARQISGNAAKTGSEQNPLSLLRPDTKLPGGFTLAELNRAIASNHRRITAQAEPPPPPITVSGLET